MDLFTRGLTSGVLSGIILNIFSFISESLGITTLPMATWTAIIIFGRTPPFSFSETIFAMLGNLMFTGLLGVVFAFLVPVITKEKLYLKGWFFSTVVWFIIYAVTTLFKVEGTMSLELNTVVSNAVSASVFGVFLTYFLNLLSISEESVFYKMKMAPAMKPNQDDNKE
ncbi:putative membrane protein [Propionispora sp. 2/2-37]|uniref:hypothetical protein n=1 Tax=Propionispora sp. 2/2-37 TaxID=1677858 RepID=UPI0006BB8D69|nr:hypothetical protein [Propionispora sp. 2/2-37]CUH95855.1 putative membrane protein [Propionispora sp. 2/2-37]